ncbi:MAG: hypothetical protein IJS62_08005 [Bacteroidales bacterium]|nr:hypothetical protein [Bacteroidales bacterium]
MKLGGKWRMPTDEEWQELEAGCSWTGIVQNDVVGVRVTAKNGNGIFLPAAGYREDTHAGNVESKGYYWSSSLYPPGPDCAMSISFERNGHSRFDGARYFGHPVRPVAE